MTLVKLAKGSTVTAQLTDLGIQSS